MTTSRNYVPLARVLEKRTYRTELDRECPFAGASAADEPAIGRSLLQDSEMPTQVLNTPEHWVVELQDGTDVHVWADAAEGLAGPEDERDYRFVNLVDVPVEDQQFYEIVGRTPSNPERLCVVVAHFPRRAVRRVK